LQICCEPSEGFEQPTKPNATRSAHSCVTLSETKGLKYRFFAPFRMTVLRSYIIKCTNVSHSGLVTDGYQHIGHTTKQWRASSSTVRSDSVPPLTMRGVSWIPRFPWGSRTHTPRASWVKTGTRSSVPERTTTSDSDASWSWGSPLAVWRGMEGSARGHPQPPGPWPAPESYERESGGPNPDLPGRVVIGTERESPYRSLDGRRTSRRGRESRRRLGKARCAERQMQRLPSVTACSFPPFACSIRPYIPSRRRLSWQFQSPKSIKLSSSVLSPISEGGERLAVIIAKMKRWEPELGEPSIPYVHQEDGIGVPRCLLNSC